MNDEPTWEHLSFVNWTEMWRLDSNKVNIKVWKSVIRTGHWVWAIDGHTQGYLPEGSTLEEAQAYAIACWRMS